MEYDKLIGRLARIKDTQNQREDHVKGMYGTITEIYGNKAHILFLLQSTVGSPMEFGVFVELERLELSDDRPLNERINDMQDQYSTAPTSSTSGPDFHFLLRQANRFTFWLLSNGYKRYACTSPVYVGDIIVWAVSPVEALAHIAEMHLQLTGDSLAGTSTVTETSVVKGVTFESNDRFREAPMLTALDSDLNP